MAELFTCKTSANPYSCLRRRQASASITEVGGLLRGLRDANTGLFWMTSHLGRTPGPNTVTLYTSLHTLYVRESGLRDYYIVFILPMFLVVNFCRGFLFAFGNTPLFSIVFK